MWLFSLTAHPLIPLNRFIGLFIKPYQPYCNQSIIRDMLSAKSLSSKKWRLCASKSKVDYPPKYISPSMCLSWGWREPPVSQTLQKSEIGSDLMGLMARKDKVNVSVCLVFSASDRLWWQLIVVIKVRSNGLEIGEMMTSLWRQFFYSHVSIKFAQRLRQKLVCSMPFTLEFIYHQTFRILCRTKLVVVVNLGYWSLDI